jgi:hypothetical protein
LESIDFEDFLCLELILPFGRIFQYILFSHDSFFKRFIIAHQNNIIERTSKFKTHCTKRITESRHAIVDPKSLCRTMKEFQYKIRWKSLEFQIVELFSILKISIQSDVNKDIRQSVSLSHKSWLLKKKIKPFQTKNVHRKQDNVFNRRMVFWQ